MYLTSLCCRLHQPSRWQDSAQVKAWTQHGVGGTHQGLRTTTQTVQDRHESGRRLASDSAASETISLPDRADHVNEIKPCRVGHDLRRGGPRGDGRTHGGQGDGHDGQGLAQGQLLLSEGCEEGRLRLTLNHRRVRRGRGHRERSGKGVGWVRCRARCVGGCGWLGGPRSLRGGRDETIERTELFNKAFETYNIVIF